MIEKLPPVIPPEIKGFTGDIVYQQNIKINEIIDKIEDHE